MIHPVTLKLRGSTKSRRVFVDARWVKSDGDHSLSCQMASVMFFGFLLPDTKSQPDFGHSQMSASGPKRHFANSSFRRQSGNPCYRIKLQKADTNLRTFEAPIDASNAAIPVKHWHRLLRKVSLISPMALALPVPFKTFLFSANPFLPLRPMAQSTSK